jgi:RNA polymerase sigma-70 factor (ECF subfamily)
MTSGERSDESVVAAFQGGSAEALSELVRRHDSALIAFLTAFCGDGHRAADLAQESWLRAMAKRHSLRDRARFRAWLLRIGQRLCLMALRGSPAVELDEAERAAPDDRTALDTLIEVEDAERVRAALAGLPPAQRAVVWLAVVEDCAHGEVARILDIPEGTARSRLHYALARLGKRLPDGGSP